MSDVERISPGQRIWRHPNEEPPQRRSPEKEPEDEKPKDEQEPSTPDKPDDGHIDVFVRPPVSPPPSL